MADRFVEYSADKSKDGKKIDFFVDWLHIFSTTERKDHYSKQRFTGREKNAVILLDVIAKRYIFEDSHSQAIG